MGCDGGTIPTRDELVRLKKKPEKKDRAAELAAKWKHCAVTQEPLRPPIVACELGRLYNKEAVIEMLLDKSKFESASNFDHVRGLKDIKELVFTENSAYKEPAKGDKGDAYIDRHAARYICPVTGLEMSGKYKFVFLWPCACVFSQRALKEVKADNCHKCGKTFRPEDVVILNGDEEDMKQMRQQMVERRLQAKLEKKAKKKHKAEATVTSATDTSEQDGPPSAKQQRLEEVLPGTSKLTNGKEAAKFKLPSDTPGPSSKLANGAAAHKSKLTNGVGTSGSKLTNGKETDLSKTKSIQKNPSASKAYKSLFTTSEACKNQPKAHWVTHNPQYY